MKKVTELYKKVTELDKKVTELDKKVTELMLKADKHDTVLTYHFSLFSP